MIDYLSIEIINTPKEVFYSNKELKFSTKIDLQSGTIHCNDYGYYTETALYENLLIEIQRNIENDKYVIKLKGSLHKYYNKGSNINDFNIYSIRESISKLTEKLKINPINCIIHQIEFGVNCKFQFPSLKIISNLLSHKGKTFELKEFNNRGYLKKFIHSHYDIKIYDKGLQYKITDNIIRIEIKVKKMQFLYSKKIHIKNINSLKTKEILESLSKILNSTAQEIIFTNDELLNYEFSNEHEKNIFFKFSNMQSILNHKLVSNRKTFNEHKRKFESIVSTYSKIDYKTIFTKSIKNKMNELLNEVTILPVLEKSDKLQFYPIVVSNYLIKKRVCLTCGRDISNQKTNSKFCSETIYGSKVKKCRNIISNFKKRETSYYPNETLFNIDENLNPYFKKIKEYAFNQ